MSHAVQPGAEPIRVADRPGTLRQNEKRGLEGVFRRVPVAQDSPADAQDHRSMPGHEHLERHRVATDGEPPEQLTLVHPRGRPFAEQASDQSSYTLDPRPGRHKVALRLPIAATRKGSSGSILHRGRRPIDLSLKIPEKPGEQAQPRSRPLGNRPELTSRFRYPPHHERKPSFRRSASERSSCRSPVLGVNPRKPLVPTLRVGTFFVPLRGALGVNPTKPLVPTLRVGTFFVPLRGALDVNRRKLFPTCSLETTMAPSFITKATRAVAVMSTVGSPGRATKSASLKTSQIAPQRRNREDTWKPPF